TIHDEEAEFARKEVLLRQQGLLAEMQLVTQKRISLQRKPSTDPSNPAAAGTTIPSLFVILPTVATTPTAHVNNTNHYHNNHIRINHSLEFRLHFVCHFGDEEDEVGDDEQEVGNDGGQVRTVPPPRLHICEDSQGYALQDTAKFCEEYKISLLSLLHAAHVSCSPPHIQQQYHNQSDFYNLHHHHLWQAGGGSTHGTAAAAAAVASLALASPSPSPPLPAAGSIIDRIEIAILYLLRSHFTEQELLEISQMSAGDDYDGDSLTQMRLSDIADSDKDLVRATMTTDGRILGPLRQKNNTKVVHVRRGEGSRRKRNASGSSSGMGSLTGGDEEGDSDMGVAPFLVGNGYHHLFDNSNGYHHFTTVNGNGTTMDTDDATPTTITTSHVQWLCPEHIHCLPSTWDNLRSLCHPNPADAMDAGEDCCVETDRAIEVSFKDRVHAKRFYEALRSAQCVVKLRIHLEWDDLSNQDLVDLARAVWEGNLSDVTLDCCCCPEGGPDGTSDDVMSSTTTMGRSASGIALAAATGTTRANSSRRQDQQGPLSSSSLSRHHEYHCIQHYRHGLSFAPLLGILYSPFLVSLTLENFDGQFPALDNSNFDVDDIQEHTFEEYMQQLLGPDGRLRTDIQLHLPSTNSLYNLVLSRCSRTAFARELGPLLFHSPDLAELQIECDHIDSVLPAIADATRQFRRLLFLKLSESSWESVEITFHKLPARSSSDMDLDEEVSGSSGSSSIEQQQHEHSDPMVVDLIRQQEHQQRQQQLGRVQDSQPGGVIPISLPPITPVQMNLFTSYQSWRHIRGLNRKTRRPPCPILQLCGAVENLATYCYLRLWEDEREALGRLLEYNPKLQSLELMCETESIVPLWRFLTERDDAFWKERASQARSRRQPPPQRPFLRLRINDEDCSLMVVSRNISILVLQSYSVHHQEILKSLVDITPAFCIGSSFLEADQIKLLRGHLEADGLLFSNMTWVLGRQVPSDEFLEHMEAILSTAYGRGQLERFTIRVYAPLLKIPLLIRLWNAVVAETPLTEAVHGAWIRGCLGLEAPSPLSNPQQQQQFRPNGSAPGPGASSTLMMTQEEMMAVSVKEIQDRASGLNRGSSSYPSLPPSSTSTPSCLHQQRPYYPAAGETAAERQMGKPSSTYIIDQKHTLVLSSSQYFYSSLSSSSGSAANHPHSAETHSLSLVTSRQPVPSPSR
ncbi:hypothetical protein BGX29_002999, partial [Mortierella sp. GBA35]